MTTADKKMRFISTDPADLLIEAMVQEKNNPHVFHPITFKVNTIEYIMHIDDDSAAIVLRSNVVIPIAMPYKDLKQKIYAPDFKDGNYLDLTEVTGTTTEDKQAPSLKDQFNEPTKQNKKDLTIRAFLRIKDARQFTMVEFKDSDIAYIGHISDNTLHPSQTSLIFTFKNPLSGIGNAFVILDNVSESEFKTLLAEAKKKNIELLDLYDYTTQRDSKRINPLKPTPLI